MCIRQARPRSTEVCQFEMSDDGPWRASFKAREPIRPEQSSIDVEQTLLEPHVRLSHGQRRQPIADKQVHEGHDVRHANDENGEQCRD